MIVLLRTENKVVAIPTPPWKVYLPILGAVVGIISVLVWHYYLDDSSEGTIVVSEVAFRGYNSLEGLSGYADVVVIGTVRKVLGREIDTGGDPAPIIGTKSGIPTIFYEVEVSEKLHGEPADTIVLARTDPDEQYSDYERPIQIGSRYMLFLLDRTGDVPGFDKFKDTKDLYVTAGLDNGVFELSENDIASPRWPSKFRVDDAETDSDGSTFKSQFTLDEVRLGIVNEISDGTPSSEGEQAFDDTENVVDGDSGDADQPTVDATASPIPVSE